MKLCTTLIAVRDLERSEKFYCGLFDQRIQMDLGWNVTLSGGFTLQLHFDRLTGLSEDDIAWKPGDMELYFEADDFDAFLEKLRAFPDVQYVHPPMTHPWKQRVVRIYDPDGHMIEIGESMAVIARRYLDKGYSAEDTAAQIQHPVSFVEAVRDGKIP